MDPLSSTLRSRSRSGSKSKTRRSIDIKQKAFRKITKFLRKTPRITKAICPSSGDCIAFGRKIDEINQMFDGFINFTKATSVTRIGEVSKNGFINEIKYETDKKYTAYAILKSSNDEESDNSS